MTDPRDPQKQESIEMNRDPITGEPGAHPIGTGLGAASGAIAGALIGGIGGPIGAAAFGTLGAIAGGLAGRDAGEAVHPTGDEVHWRNSYRSEPYFSSLYNYEDYAPAYRAAWIHRMSHPEGSWAQAEIDLKAGWEHCKDKSHLLWDDARHAAHAAWHRVRSSTSDSKPD